MNTIIPSIIVRAKLLYLSFFSVLSLTAAFSSWSARTASTASFFAIYVMYRFFSIVADASISRESTVDITAASGAARKRPAAHTGMYLFTTYGMIESVFASCSSPTSGNASVPAKCIPIIRMPTTTVPQIIALCSDSVSLNPMLLTAV